MGHEIKHFPNIGEVRGIGLISLGIFPGREPEGPLCHNYARIIHLWVAAFVSYIFILRCVSLDEVYWYMNFFSSRLNGKIDLIIEHSIILLLRCYNGWLKFCFISQIIYIFIWFRLIRIFIKYERFVLFVLFYVFQGKCFVSMFGFFVRRLLGRINVNGWIQFGLE